MLYYFHAVVISMYIEVLLLFLFFFALFYVYSLYDIIINKLLSNEFCYFSTGFIIM